jgi:hypothetical protein
MERRLGLELEGIRVHDGAEAERSARALGARAYATGTDLVFAAGAYAPATGEGERLLGHELAHVAQQREGDVARAPGAEPEAAAVAASPGREPGRAPVRERAPTGVPQAARDPVMEREWLRLAQVCETREREPGPGVVSEGLGTALDKLRTALRAAGGALPDAVGEIRIPAALDALDRLEKGMGELVVALGQPDTLVKAGGELERLVAALRPLERLGDPGRDPDRYGRALDEALACAGRLGAALPPGPWVSPLRLLESLRGRFAAAARRLAAAAEAGASPESPEGPATPAR